MTFCFMSSSEFQDRLEFRCPVCRAKQELQPECRRCHADLTLVVRAHRRAEYLVAAGQQADERGDVQEQWRIREELKQLSPGVLRTD
ncbi:MAG: hypothetical protein R3C59_08865 [Planctomycetaceae bacterium]